VGRVKALAQFSLQDERARKKEGVFQTCGPAERNIEEGIAKVGPLGFVLASERCMVGIRCGDYKRVSIGEGRYEDPRIASRNDHDLVSHARSVEHFGEIGWRERFS
jgi:hypothetical protein